MELFIHYIFSSFGTLKCFYLSILEIHHFYVKLMSFLCENLKSAQAALEGKDQAPRSVLSAVKSEYSGTQPFVGEQFQLLGTAAVELDPFSPVGGNPGVIS